MRKLLLSVALVCLVQPAALAGDYQGNRFNFANPSNAPLEPGEALQYAPPVEPKIPPVQFLKQEPPVTLREHVDHLLYGIKVDIPPEYDVYGYELRRYMAHIGGPEVLGNEERLGQELKNIRKAKIILKYWNDDVTSRISEIKKKIEAEKPSADILTSFKFNSGLAMAFMAECQVWIKKNEDFLNFLSQKQGAYTYNDPTLVFHDEEDRRAFAAHYIAARNAQKIINEYVPFATMVY